MLLTKEQKQELMQLADGFHIPPNFVQDMYENGQLYFDVEEEDKDFEEWEQKQALGAEPAKSEPTDDLPY